MTHYKTILYVDLDVHHGDGVEYAFAHTERVVTLSFHVHEPGFFPGTGGGSENGKAAYNVPFTRLTKNAVWEETVKRCTEMVWRKYNPGCLLLQCGCDGNLLAGFI
jgi:acetoin utilization deacetylase AcuC-like enzyme